MNQSLLLTSFCLACCLSTPGFGQRSAGPIASTVAEVSIPFGSSQKDQLPADLPQAKLLFIKYSPATVPANRPDNMPRRQYKLLEHHNDVYQTANQQLMDAAARYPFAYRITTQDSSKYYATRGYKYALFHTSFNAPTDGTFVGTRSRGQYSANGPYFATTTVELFVQDLTTGTRYDVDTFSETFIYYYKGIVGKFLKKVDKQFHVRK